MILDGGASIGVLGRSNLKGTSFVDSEALGGSREFSVSGLVGIISTTGFGSEKTDLSC